MSAQRSSQRNPVAIPPTRGHQLEQVRSFQGVDIFLWQATIPFGLPRVTGEQRTQFGGQGYRVGAAVNLRSSQFSLPDYLNLL